MRVLAIDYGSKRVGLAVSDALEITANPLAVLDRKGSDQEVVEAVARIVQEEGVDEVVVGLPVNMDGSHGPAAAGAEAFAAKVATRLQMPVYTHDERLTSEEAQERMIGANVSWKRRRRSVDRVAAAVILEGYLRAPDRLARLRGDTSGA